MQYTIRVETCPRNLALKAHPWAGVQGTAKRWAQVSAAVRTRTEAEVIDMAKHGLRGGAGAPNSNQAFTGAGKRGKLGIDSDATVRDHVFSDVDVNCELRSCCFPSALATILRGCRIGCIELYVHLGL